MEDNKRPTFHIRQQWLERAKVLDPVLFFLFINDLPNIFSGSSSKICLFADDAPISFTANNREDLEIRVLQEVPQVFQWFTKNHLTLNNDKTEAIYNFLVYIKLNLENVTNYKLIRLKEN